MSDNNPELSSRARASQTTHQACFGLDALAGPSRGTCFSTLLLAFALLFCAGCKKKESPPKPREQSAIIGTRIASGSAFAVSLTMNPAQPKFARKTIFHVAVKQDSGAPVEGAQAEISLVMPLMDMGKNQFRLKQVGTGEYEGVGEFTMAGEWEVIVTASAQGKTGKTTFNVNVVE